jgi:hypothetical protein
LRTSQLVLITVALGVFVVGLSRGIVGALFGLVLAAGIGAIVLTPVAGRTLEQWVPIVAHFRRRSQRTMATSAERLAQEAANGAARLPALGDVSITGVQVNEGAEAAVIHDGPAAVAVLAVHGTSFALLDEDERGRRVMGWGQALSALARPGSAVDRVQWLVRVLPDTGNALQRYWRGSHFPAGDVESRRRAARSYLELIAAAGPVTQAHECYLAVRLDQRRARRAVAQAGNGRTGAATVLIRELASVSDRLDRAGLQVAGALPPRGLARVLRTAYELRSLDPIDRRVGDDAGVAAHAAGPVATASQWAAFRSDDAWHATYWIAEWPRLDVAADFLAPLLLRPSCRRTLSLVAEPVDPRRAARQIAAARTADLANASMRARIGQLTTERHHAEAEQTNRREAELVAGHGEFRFVGYLTVSACTRELLEEGCGEVEHAAHQSYLEIRRLYGQQRQAFLYTLPLARGLR